MLASFLYLSSSKQAAPTFSVASRQASFSCRLFAKNSSHTVLHMSCGHGERTCCECILGSVLWQNHPGIIYMFTRVLYGGAKSSQSSHDNVYFAQSGDNCFKTSLRYLAAAPPSRREPFHMKLPSDERH